MQSKNHVQHEVMGVFLKLYFPICRSKPYRLKGGGVKGGRGYEGEEGRESCCCLLVA